MRWKTHPKSTSTPSGLMVTRPQQALLLHNSLVDTVVETCTPLPLSDAMTFLRAALGGQFVEGSRTLLSGSPGGGESRLATQVCLDLGLMGMRSLSLMTEAGPAQLKRLALQLSADWPTTQAQRAMSHMHVEHSPDLMKLPEFLMRQVLAPGGTYYGVKLIVLDSIQGDGLASTAIKTYSKVVEFARFCKEAGIATLLLCHVNKAGDIAGPKTLEHAIDTAMILRRAMRLSLLNVRKNRYGPPLLKPIPLKINPVTTRVEPAPHCEARPAMARTYAGPATGLLEMQAAVGVPGDAARGRMTAPGLPRREIEQLVSCISGMPDMDFGDLDYTIHCRRPGSGPYQPNFGLPLCMSLIGSYIRESVPTHHMYLGEIDLFRHVRRLPSNLTPDLRTALDAGEVELPLTLYLPAADAPQFSGCGKGITVVGCHSLEDAVFHTWPNLR